MSKESRCPDSNPYCDGTDLLHGEWCKEASMVANLEREKEEE